MLEAEKGRFPIRCRRDRPGQQTGCTWVIGGKAVVSCANGTARVILHAAQPWKAGGKKRNKAERRLCGQFRRWRIRDTPGLVRRRPHMSSSRFFPCFIVHRRPFCITDIRRRCCTRCCTGKLLALPHDSALSGQRHAFLLRLLLHRTPHRALLECLLVLTPQDTYRFSHAHPSPHTFRLPLRNVWKIQRWTSRSQAACSSLSATCQSRMCRR